MMPDTTRPSSPETSSAHRFYEGPSSETDGIQLRHRYFSYRNASGLIVGKTLNVSFTLEAAARAIWPVFKDFNLWQNSFGQHYSGVIGDLEGETFALGPQKNLGPQRYRVLKVVPEHLIIVSKLSADDRGSDSAPDSAVFILHEFDGKTMIVVAVEHAEAAETVEQGLDRWRNVATRSQEKWLSAFVPSLKRLVFAAPASS